MKQIYTANQSETITLILRNSIGLQSVVKVNEIIFDDVTLGESKGNFRQLELTLNSGDDVSITDNNNLKFEIL